MKQYIVINFDPQSESRVYHFCSLETFFRILLKTADELPRTALGGEINIPELQRLLQIDGIVKLKHSSGHWFILDPFKY